MAVPLSARIIGRKEGEFAFFIRGKGIIRGTTSYQFLEYSC
jgi:hypothetical protein